MKIEIVRKIDENTTIVVNELAKNETLVAKTESVVKMVALLTGRLSKKN